MTYLDIGCYDGDTVDQFFNWAWLYGNPYEFDVYAFDPNPAFKERWEVIKTHKPKVNFQNKAAWTYDGHVELVLDDLGSTIMKEKKQGETIMVECFDLARFLKRLPEDYIVVKMDIEGAELPLLTHLIKQEADWKIDMLLVEWHDGKMPEYDSNKDWIMKNLKCEWHEWR